MKFIHIVEVNRLFWFVRILVYLKTGEQRRSKEKVRGCLSNPLKLELSQFTIIF